MAIHNTNRRKQKKLVSTLMVRLDQESKDFLSLAAQMRKISVSDYVRSVTIAQAKREVIAAQRQSILLSAPEQLELWEALNEPTKRLSARQRLLGKIMRGEHI